jgi:integrase
VLRLFCGIRTGEVSRLEWTEVHWLDPKPYVHIPAGKAKKRQIRHVEIPPNALAWLQVCNPPAAGRIDPKSALTYAKRFGRISKLAGIGKKDASGEWVSDWESNDTRHSFGSYDYALHGDAIRTARLMGHKQGDDVLFAHYRSLVTKEEAEKYFGLAPDSSDNVEKFPASAVS